MKTIRSLPFIFFIIIELCFAALLISPGTVSASTLDSNLLSNSDAEAGSISSWTDDTGQSRWFAAENTWNASHSGTYSFSVQAPGFAASGTWSLSQTVSISDQSALINAGNLVANLSGWYLKSGSGTDRARLVLQELDASGNVLRESGPYCSGTNTWEQGTVSQAVMANTVSLKVLLCGIDLDNSRVQFDDLSLVISNNSGAAPTIVQGISDQEITVGDPLGPFNITVNDTDTPLNNLVVTAVSSNQTLVPDANLSPGGSGGTRTLSITPVADKTGEADITINVSDGAKSAQSSFHLRINPAANLGVNLVVNGDASQAAQSTYIPGWSGSDWSRFVLNSGTKTFTVSTAPSGSIYLEQSINVNSRRDLIDSGFLNFQASAGLTGGAELIISGLNQVGSEIWSFSGSSITQAIPANTYYIKVKIGGPLSAQISNVSLIILNDLPKIQSIADQNISENSNTGALDCKVGYITAGIIITGTSSDQTLVPNGNIVFGGSGFDRTLTVTPAANKSGSCTITVTANDGSQSASRSFTLTVNPVPRVSSVNAPAAGSYKTESILNFTVNFNTPVTVNGGTPYIPITLDTGGTVNAACTSSAFPANSLAFSYTVASGNLDMNGITAGAAIEVNGGTIRSAAGYDAVLALGTVDTSLVKVDGIAPVVDDANPTTCYSAETHTLTVKISETGGIATGQGNSAVDVSKFKVWSGTDSRTLTTGQSSTVITDTGTITITLGGTDLTAIQAFSGGEKLDKVDVAAGGIIDAAGNLNAEDLNNAIVTLGAAEVAADKAALAITYAVGDSANGVTQNLGLSISGANGTTISWQSSPEGIIAANGTVTRPSTGDVNVNLNATISKSGVSDTKTFIITVKISDAGAVAVDKSALAITYAGSDNAGSVTQNLGLLDSGANGTTIGWQSSPAGVIANDGTVTRPSSGDINVTLTATISKNGASDTKTFPVTVKISDAGAVANDKAALAITYASGDNAGSVTQDLGLLDSGANGTTITWQSSPAGVIANDGTVTRPSSGDINVTLIATVSKNGASDTKSFPVTVKISNTGAVAADKTALAITFASGDSAGSVTQSVYLPVTGSFGSNISWQSDNNSIITNDGTVSRPSDNDAAITLTATISKSGASDTKAFPVTVKISNTGAVAADKTALAITFASGDSAGSVTQSVYLPVTGSFGSSISWQSDNNTIITNDGTVSRPSFSAGDAHVTVTASLSKSGVTDTKQFPLNVVKLPISDVEAVAADKAALAITFAPGDSAGSVTQSVYLPTTATYGSSISWQSGNLNLISNAGVVTRPSFTAGNADVTVTACVYRNLASDLRQYNLTIIRLPVNDQESVEQAKNGLEIGYSNSDWAGAVTNNITLPLLGANGTSIIWVSSNPEIISSNGTVNRPVFSSTDATVTLTATISKGNIQDTKQFALTVTKQSPSTNADLSSLSLNGTTILPEFSADTLSYTASVPNSTRSILINFTAADSTASVRVNNNPAAGSTVSELNTGTNTVLIEVTAQDSSQKTYTLTIYRRTNSDDTDTASSASPTSNPAPPAGSTSVSATVEPSAGGTVNLGSEVVVQIPPDALNETVPPTVEICKTTAPPASPTGFVVAGNVFELKVGDKTSYQFNQPVTLSFSFNPADFPPGSKPEVYYYDSEKSAWVSLGGTVSDNTITIKVDHFTMFAVMVEEDKGKAPATPQAVKPAFNDIADHWAQKAIEQIVTLGAASGYPDGTFKPDRTITRAEFAAMLVKAWKLEPKTGQVFADTAGHWGKEYIATATAHGIVCGYADKMFGPDDPVTREQMALMIVKATQLADASGETAFADRTDVSVWAQNGVSAAIKAGIIKGYPDNTFKPKGNATRAEAVTVILNAVTKGA